MLLPPPPLPALPMVSVARLSTDFSTRVSVSTRAGVSDGAVLAGSLAVDHVDSVRIAAAIARGRAAARRVAIHLGLAAPQLRLPALRLQALQPLIPLSAPKATTWHHDLQEPDGIATNVILHSKDHRECGAPIATTTYVIPVSSHPGDAAL